MGRNAEVSAIVSRFAHETAMRWIEMGIGQGCPERSGVFSAGPVSFCPFDTLYFRSPKGEVILPETIRKFKLNLMGKRLVK